MPESMLGTACLALVVVWWALAARDDVPLTAVLAAALLLAAHVASVLLSYGPPALPVGGRVLRLWLRRAAVVGAAAPLVWAGRGGASTGSPSRPASGWPGSAARSWSAWSPPSR